MAYTGNIPYPWGAGRDVTANSSPLTHHDNLSVLRMLEWLRDRCDEIEGEIDSTVEALGKTLRELIATLDAENDSDRTRIEKSLGEKISELRAAVETAVSRDLDSFFSYDPTDGRRDETVSVALDRAYAESRVFAYRASEEDGLGLTAAQTDALERTAIVHDLKGAGDVLNILPGDFTAENTLVKAPKISELEKTIGELSSRIETLEKKAGI